MRTKTSRNPIAIKMADISNSVLPPLDSCCCVICLLVSANTTPRMKVTVTQRNETLPRTERYFFSLCGVCDCATSKNTRTMAVRGQGPIRMLCGISPSPSKRKKGGQMYPTKNPDGYYLFLLFLSFVPCCFCRYTIARCKGKTSS